MHPESGKAFHCLVVCAKTCGPRAGSDARASARVGAWSVAGQCEADAMSASERLISSVSPASDAWGGKGPPVRPGVTALPRHTRQGPRIGAELPDLPAPAVGRAVSSRCAAGEAAGVVGAAGAEECPAAPASTRQYQSGDGRCSASAGRNLTRAANGGVPTGARRVDRCPWLRGRATADRDLTAGRQTRGALHSPCACIGQEFAAPAPPISAQTGT